MNSPEPAPVDLDDIAHIIDEYRHAKHALDYAQQRVDELRRQIEERMGDSESGLINGLEVVRWRNITSRRIDTQAVKEYLGTKYDEFTTITSSRRFSIEASGATK